MKRPTQILLWHDDSPGVKVWVRHGLLRRLGVRRTPFATLTEMLHPDATIGGGFPGMTDATVGDTRPLPAPATDLVMPLPPSAYGTPWRRCRARLRRDEAEAGHWGRCDRAPHWAHEQHALERGLMTVVWTRR